MNSTLAIQQKLNKVTFSAASNKELPFFSFFVWLAAPLLLPSSVDVPETEISTETLGLSGPSHNGHCTIPVAGKYLCEP